MRVWCRLIVIVMTDHDQGALCLGAMSIISRVIMFVVSGLVVVVRVTPFIHRQTTKRQKSIFS